jgi:hypothetical protein
VAERNPDGTWKPGASANPQGRTPIPEWLRGKTDDLLRLQLQAATEGRLPIGPADGVFVPESERQWQPVESQHRIKALDSLLDRLLGRAPLAETSSASTEAVAELLAAIATGAKK